MSQQAPPPPHRRNILHTVIVADYKLDIVVLALLASCAPLVGAVLVGQVCLRFGVDSPLVRELTLYFLAGVWVFSLIFTLGYRVSQLKDKVQCLEARVDRLGDYRAQQMPGE